MRSLTSISASSPQVVTSTLCIRKVNHSGFQPFMKAHGQPALGHTLMSVSLRVAAGTSWKNMAIKALNDQSATVLVVGAGFIGVEWVTELRHYFPKLKNTIIDFLPNPLGPLPVKAAEYCKHYMKRNDIAQFYQMKYAPDDMEFWKKIDLPDKADKEYVCIGVKASNYFMPAETLSEKGPGGGGWIHMDMTLAVCTKDMKLWSKDDQGNSRVFAIGDCNTGGISVPDKKVDDWPMPPIPKISYPGEEQAVIACKNLVKVDKRVYQRKRGW